MSSSRDQQRPGRKQTQEPDPLSDLITTFYELNGSVIEELDQEPSPLEFMRYVSRNTPFVVRKGAATWAAATTWSPDFLEAHLGGQEVNVAVTPKGNADAPTVHQDGSVVFAKPWEEDQPFKEFLGYLIRQETDPSFPPNSEVRYAQTQNDNLRHEYSTLFGHVQPSIPFARIALDTEPEAINMWIGNSHSTTAMHKDNYENVYVQVLGRKHFVLLPGLCFPCVNERELRGATYRRRGKYEGGSLVLELDGGEEKDGGTGGDGEDGDGEGGRGEKVPFATWDPDRPDENSTPYSKLARPMRVTLEPGDMMYLPAMWYHKVSQSCLGEGICVAVNYWFDMEYSGPLYPFSSFVRNSTRFSRDREGYAGG